MIRFLPLMTAKIYSHFEDFILMISFGSLSMESRSGIVILAVSISSYELISKNWIMLTLLTKKASMETKGSPLDPSRS